MTLYHGSNKLINDKLKPFTSFHYTPYVYATSDYYYALARAGKFDINKFLLREEYDGNILTLVELEPNAFEEVFNTSGYVYTVDSTLFYHKDEFMINEYVSDKECSIENTMYISNIKEEMLKYKSHYNIIRYEDSEPYWVNVKGGREGYLQRRTERVNKVNNKGE